VNNTKKTEEICLVVQARLGSQRVPRKMLREFCGTTLVDILFEKLKNLKNIPLGNVYFSAHEPELKEVAEKHNINIFHRSKKSADSEGEPLSEIYEWHDKLPLNPKYVIMVSACNPLLKTETIDSFVKCFIESNKEGAFSVFEKKTYFWDKNNESITDWGNSTIMNTKLVDPVYEAGHCLYASRLDIIKDGFWLDTKSPPEPELFVMDELEAFDIDYEWQFKMGELLYDNLR
jgi:CMP-N-acetylneuraminic acid synthetase|tara:strand:- start:2837 stop:3532 length:696 start_codon:yes stop_codon:yes gene_type:complete